ncbi:MAG TPA: RNA polymerase sigma-70 factor [Gemmatimonadaceae bacterium]
MRPPLPPGPRPDDAPDNAPDDPALLDALRRGDEAAFDRAFRAWYPRMVGAANAMLRDLAVAEEIAQDVMFELWRRREQFPPDTALRSYAFRAVRNRALNHARHLRVERDGARVAAQEEAQEPLAPSELVSAELEAAIVGAVEALPPRCREVFELSRVKGLRYAEIAEAMGLSVKTVDAQMGKALRIMRERLAPWLPGGERL